MAGGVGWVALIHSTKDTCKIAFLLASPFSKMSREAVIDGSNCNSYSYSLAKQQFPFIAGEDRQVQNIVS
jgi:hypothetical protein